MLAVSTVAMFGLMYPNTYTLDDVFFSQTRLRMVFVMGAAVAVVMLGFMWTMYKNTRANLAIVRLSFLIFAGALWLVRSQRMVKAMIPRSFDRRVDE